MSIPTGIPILESLKHSGALKFLFPMLFVSILVISIISVRGTVGSMGARRAIILLVILAASAFYFAYIEDTRKVHFLEYELIALLLFKAIEIDLKSHIIYPLTLIILAALGLIEETVQAFYPDRTFDFQDIRIDMIASIFMMCIIWIFSGKRFSTTRP